MYIGRHIEAKMTSDVEQRKHRFSETKHPQSLLSRLGCFTCGNRPEYGLVSMVTTRNLSYFEMYVFFNMAGKFQLRSRRIGIYEVSGTTQKA